MMGAPADPQKISINSINNYMAMQQTGKIDQKSMLTTLPVGHFQHSEEVSMSSISRQFFPFNMTAGALSLTVEPTHSAYVGRNKQQQILNTQGPAVKLPNITRNTNFNSIQPENDNRIIQQSSTDPTQQTNTIAASSQIQKENIHKRYVSQGEDRLFMTLSRDKQTRLPQLITGSAEISQIKLKQQLKGQEVQDQQQTNSDYGIVSKKKKEYETLDPTKKMVTMLQKKNIQSPENDGKNQLVRFEGSGHARHHSLDQIQMKQIVPPTQTRLISLIYKINNNKSLKTSLVDQHLNNFQSRFKIIPNSQWALNEKKQIQSAQDFLVLCSNGIMSLEKAKNGITGYVSNSQFIEDGITNLILQDVPFFQKFKALSCFRQWKDVMRQNAYERKRQLLASNYICAKPIFSSKFSLLIQMMNHIRELSLIEIQPQIVYGKKQASTLDEKCKTVLDQNNLIIEGLLVELKDELVKLRKEIIEDQQYFDGILKEQRVEELLKNKNKPKGSDKNNSIAIQNQNDKQNRITMNQYDELLLLVFRYWSNKMIELLVKSKHQFTEIFLEPSNQTQFEISLCFDQETGLLSSDPSLDEHKQTFVRVFEHMENAVFKNQFLQFFVHDLNDLFFSKPPKYTKQIFEQMSITLKANNGYQKDHQAIFNALNRDSDKCKQLIDSYKGLQEIYNVCSNWKQTQNERNSSQVEMGFYKETWQKMNRFSEKIKEIPQGSKPVGSIVLETTTLKKKLSEMPKDVLDSIRHNIIGTMEQETRTLKEELSKTTEILDQLPTSLNTYVEQVNTLKYIEFKKEDFKQKYETIDQLYKDCQNDNIKVHYSLTMQIEEVKNLYTELPKHCATSAEQLAQNKDTMERIMNSSSQVLSKKIKAFEKKYVETYLHDKSRLDDCGDTLEELFKRSKAIHEIRSKVILYREFLKLLYEKEPNPEEKMASNKLSCAEDFDSLQEIHKHTIRLWKILLYWKKRRQICYHTPFLHLDTQMIIKSIHKVMRFLEDKLPQHEFVFKQSKSLTKIISQQVKETNLIIDFVKDLRKDCLQKRHWMQIFELIKAPHLKSSDRFTIVELREYNIQNSREEIQEIIKHANTEAKYEGIFKEICSEWENLEMKIIPFKDTQNSYIMVNTDTLNQAIEENLNTLEQIQKSQYAIHIKTEIMVWITKLKTMHTNLDIWVTAQRHWINLDVIYNSGLFSNLFDENTKHFIDTRLQFQRIMWSSYKNPKAIYNLLIDSRIKIFQDLTKHLQILQDKVHDFLEDKRLAFSRFFFLNDSQLLEFLTLANTSQDFSAYINTLFIGAQNLYIQPADQVKLLKHEGEKNITEESDSISDDEESSKKPKNSYLGVENSKMAIEGVSDYQVLGMISQNKELFLFEQSVKIINDDKNIKEIEGFEVSGTGTGNIEQWLIKVEQAMRNTMGKQIQYAVRSFATRALDEWVLDYPQQVILTTINLVLTNEINDILEEKQRQRELAEAEGSEMDGDMPLMRDIETHGDFEHPAEGDGEKKDAKDGDDALSEGAEEPEQSKKRNQNSIKLTADVEQNKIVKDLFGDDFKQDDKFRAAIEQAKADLRQKKLNAANTGAAQNQAKASRKPPNMMFKDHVMEVLGQQTFYGIFLRVQFWINKLIRSLQSDDRRMDWQDKVIEFQLTGVQKMVMRNVILYLLYQRDNLAKIMALDINDKNDFEWLSKIKVVWNEFQEDDSKIQNGAPIQPLLLGPYIQCGGWQQQLGNEYLGSRQRIPLSPLTDRYYVFMSSALREKSGVLLRCGQSHQHATDIFEEFASLCHMAHKSLFCHAEMQVGQLMQIINGAAMAKFWIFFEHIDILPVVNFQIIIKEIQMVQQQYIIAELADQELLQFGNNVSKTLHIDKNLAGAKEELSGNWQFSEKILDSQLNKKKSDEDLIVKAMRPSLGIFASLSSKFIINQNKIADQLTLQAQSTFRTISLAKPDLLTLMTMIFKAEGYYSYKKLANLTYQFIEEFQMEKNKILYGENNNVEQIDKISEGLVIRDVKNAIRLSIILKDQEFQGYMDRLFKIQKKQYKFELFLYEKTLAEKMAAHERLEDMKREVLIQKEKIEVDTMQKGFTCILKSKFFNEWRAAFQHKQNQIDPTILIDEKQAEDDIDRLINSTFKKIADIIRQQEEEEEAKREEERKKNPYSSQSQSLPPRNKARARRKLTHSSTIDLNFATKRQNEEGVYNAQLEDAMDKVIEAMKIEPQERQCYNCLGVLEYMRQKKGIAIVGPVCSGKTQILKIVSQTLKVAFDINFRTAAINPLTFTAEEFFGPVNSFESQIKKDKDEALKKKNIFQIVIDGYQYDKQSMSDVDQSRFLQSILIDTDRVDEAFMESLIHFFQMSNLRERQYYQDQEFLLHLASKGIAHETLIQHLPIVLPNGNIVMFPSDLYFFFETQDISNASPLFLSQIGLVITQDCDVEWMDIYTKFREGYFEKHRFFSEQVPHKIGLIESYLECENKFLLKIIKDLNKIPSIVAWPLWELKSLVQQFFRILNQLTFRLSDACDKNVMNDDPMIFPISYEKKDAIFSIILCSFVMTFGVCLNKEMQRSFEGSFTLYKSLFKIVLNAAGQNRPTIFDIYYDVDKLNWEIIQEKLEFKLKLGWYPEMSSLLVPTPDISLSFFILEQLTGYISRDSALDKNFRVLGPSGTSKSVILSTFILRSQEQFESIVVPMSSYLSFERLKKVIENHYVAKRKKIYAPRDPNKKVIIMIDDLHLQGNLNLNVLEFMRSWTQSRGYFDVGAGLFKRITDFSIVMAQNSSYRVTKCKAQGRDPLKNRFLYYTNTQYTDEIPIQKYASFIQFWLTSKAWEPNRLLQKYYIIITNGIIALLEKVKRTDQLHSSSFTRLFSFELLSKFCSSLVLNTIISEDPIQIGLKGQKEEDIVANIVLYEVLRSYSDRIYKPADRKIFAQKAVDLFRNEFQMKETSVEAIDALVLGNYHERQTQALIKLVNQENKLEKVKEIINQKISEKSNNHLLQMTLDTPNGIRDIFKISRVIFKEQQHLILCGGVSSAKYEVLQIATLLNDIVLLEINAPKFNEPTKFEMAFREALEMVVRLNNVHCFVVINESQVRDATYIDFVYNFISNCGRQENCILMNSEFSNRLTEIEIEIFMKNKENFKYDKNKKPDRRLCLEEANKKLIKYCHVVFLVNELQTYHEWFSLFPGLEAKCELMFFDDLAPTGYVQLSKNFLERTRIDEDMEDKERDNLVRSMIYAKDAIKTKIFQLFYSYESQRRHCYDEYLNGLGVETVYSSDKKRHFNLFEDGLFSVYDPLIKQVNYNMRAEISLVMKSRYQTYLEVFRFLWDFLSLNLSIRKNYFETFLNKTRQFTQFFDEINSKKKELHSTAHNINFKLTMIQDKINRITRQIMDKKATINQRKQEIIDLQSQLRKVRTEVDQVLSDLNMNLELIMRQIGKLNEKELSIFQNPIEYFTQHEQTLLQKFAMVIDMDINTDHFDPQDHGLLFQDQNELVEQLEKIRNLAELPILIFKDLKEFVLGSQSEDFEKTQGIKVIYSYVVEIFKKCNVKFAMKNQFILITEVEGQIQSNEFSINYSETFIREKSEELIVLENKIVRMRQRDGKLSKKIEVAEISHMRTQQILKNVIEYGNKIENKLDKVNMRLNCLAGDCIILSASICFLGFFSSEERIEIRAQIAKFIEDVEKVPSSPVWRGEGPQKSMFKAILKEYGLTTTILRHNYSPIITDNTFYETLFHLLFAPSCPLIVDPTGEIQQFLKNVMVSNLHTKQIYGSDYTVNQQLAGVFKSHGTFAFLNDLNSFDKANFGLCQDQSLLNRLPETFYNGVDFNYERALMWKQIPNINDKLFSSFTCLNKKVPVNEPHLENVSMYQVQCFQPGFDWQNSDVFMSKASIFVSMSSNQDIFGQDQKPTKSDGVPNKEATYQGMTAWMEIKELLLEEINNNEWKQIQEVKSQIKEYEIQKGTLKRAYENHFLVTNHETLQKMDEYTGLKQSIEDIQTQTEERILYKRMYTELLNKYELLTYYSKIILNMYLSLKTTSKILNEVTCSWNMFKIILKQILKQALQAIAQEVLAKNQPQNRSIGNDRPQVDIDLQFFQVNLIPKLHRTLTTMVKQESSAPLFNLILANRIGQQLNQVTYAESQFFFKQLLVLKDFQLWRKTEIDFVDMQSEISKQTFMGMKRELSKIYPNFGKAFMEILEKDLGQTYKYKDASLFIYRQLKEPRFQNLTLMQEINLSFTCPDHEFKSKLTEFVYQILSEVFEFSEELSKFHQFVSRAAWRQPIALISTQHVNIINTISSIAQYFGVGLDVIRTDQEADKAVTENMRGVNLRIDKIIRNNLKDQTYMELQLQEQKNYRLESMATNYLSNGNVGQNVQSHLGKLNYTQVSLRQQFENPDKTIVETQEVDPVVQIEQSAMNGSWVLVSTIKFPQFWKRVCNKLEQLESQNLINDHFRIIFDLQGYSQNEISDSFLFNHSVPFYLSEQNMEEFQGFEDIWSAILDERVLHKLNMKIDLLRAQIETKAQVKEDASDKESSKTQPVEEKEKDESPSNLKLIQSTVKSQTQRDLYEKFMLESKKHNLGLKFNILPTDQE